MIQAGSRIDPTRRTYVRAIIARQLSDDRVDEAVAHAPGSAVVEPAADDRDEHVLERRLARGDAFDAHVLRFEPAQHLAQRPLRAAAGT